MPEIDKPGLEKRHIKISKLIQDVGTIQQRNRELNSTLKAKEVEINDLKQQTEKLKVENIGLVSRVCTLEGKVKDLEEQIITMRDEKKNLEKRVRSLETQVKAIIDEIKPHRQENSELRRKNMMAMLKVEFLESEVKDFESSFEKSVHDLKQVNTILGKKVEDIETKLSAMRSVSSDDLVLSQLCLRVQSMIFKEVLPPAMYDERIGYSVYYIKEEIEELPDEEDINTANEAWTRLQSKMEWQQKDVYRLAVVMRIIQTERNVTAHPQLTEEMLHQSANRMKDAGKLYGRCSYEDAMELISVWKKLKELQ